jgi:GNAT superfamily N-acetyltransferase
VDQTPTVRTYAPTDADACRRLWAELTDYHRDTYDDPTVGGSDPGRAFDAYLERPDLHALWVAEAEDAILGFAGLLVADGKAELEPIVVAAGARRRGVGAALAAVAIATARKAGTDQLAVRPVGRNIDAMRFFRELGFDVLGRVDLRFDFNRQTRRPGERIAGRDFRV